MLNLINEILTNAKNNSIAVLSTNSGKKKTHSNYDIHNFINLNVQGSFQNISLFLQGIHTLKHKVHCNEINIKKLNNSDALEARFNLICYAAAGAIK